MKLVVLFLLVSSTASACNQKMYDNIYRVITREAIARGLAATTPEQDRKVSMDRASEIMSLRRLCNGQRSSYELTPAKLRRYQHKRRVS